MKKIALTALFLSATTVLLADTAQERLEESARVFSEVMRTPDKGIPQDLLGKAQCVVIVPGMKKGAFLVGGEYGRGFAECRREGGTGWAAPAAVRMEGGSFGLQLGVSSTDLVLLVMNEHGMRSLLSDKFTLGADASVAAGPVGRTANADTDLKLNAEILAWSRAKGLFAGISVNGATLRNDLDENAELYGSRLTSKEVIMGTVAMPPAALRLTTELDRYSLRKEGSNADRSRQ